MKSPCSLFNANMHVRIALYINVSFINQHNGQWFFDLIIKLMLYYAIMDSRLGHKYHFMLIINMKTRKY